MPGAEASIILGVISSIIKFIDESKKLYDAASNKEWLPEAFREVADQLPIIMDILDSAKQSIGTGDGKNASEDFLKAKKVKIVVEACQTKARKLDELFKKVIPADGASQTEQYISAIKQLGNGSQVQKLMKGILEDIHRLVSERGVNCATEKQLEELAKAIMELGFIEEEQLRNVTFSNVNSGWGEQNNNNNVVTGNQYSYHQSGGGRMFISDYISFGSDAQVMVSMVQSTTLGINPQIPKSSMLGRKMLIKDFLERYIQIA